MCPDDVECRQGGMQVAHRWREAASGRVKGRGCEGTCICVCPDDVECR